MTISKAYSYLEKEQVVERRPGRPLVVRDLRTEEIRHTKIDRLRESLAPTVTVARQLGIDRDEAVRVFDEMLSRGAGDPDDEHEEEQT
jgi:DNA-binding transcriptional regulator YhcF (GntR family)